jgi:hypothetical protein
MSTSPPRTGWKGYWPATATICLLSAVARFASGFAQDLPASLPQLPFHLTARPWKPLDVSSSEYLDAIEGVCRFTARQQDTQGAVIDPFLSQEHQYSTPYFAFAVGALVHAGRASDLLENGVRAMDHATECFAKGDDGIPDQHGEFFLASLPGSLELYRDHVPAERLELWRSRMMTAKERVIRGGMNNWRTYAMKGEWLRAKLGLAAREQTESFIENAWLRAEQRDRIAKDKWNCYEDHGTDPESHAVEAVGRGNLLALIEAGYDGKSREEMRRFVERGTAVTLLLQDPTGQCPPGGRTDDHVFNDVLYQLCFEVMAERAMRTGDTALAGQYRHAAMLSFKSIGRWRRNDEKWSGSYYVTKNHFDPARRVGYQAASNYGNYNGAVMMHLSEAYLARMTEIPELPAPVEIGGYAFATDEKFSSAVANAGGMQMFAALRGDTVKVYDHYWTALGVERFGRVNWDTRLGPSDGVRDGQNRRGVTFAPTWLEDGQWVRMADLPDRYRAKFSVQFVHPLLVRCAIDYSPNKSNGPAFRHEFVLTPDGVLASLRSTNVGRFGVTWPLLADDGAVLHTKIEDHFATTAYDLNADQQCFLDVGGGNVIQEPGQPVQSTYGWLSPIRAEATTRINHTFVYPRSAGDPSAQQILGHFHLAQDGFESDLGIVHGTLYTGRTSAGGEGQSIDCDGDGKIDARFDTRCQFVLQLHQGKIQAVEADRKTAVRIGDKLIQLKAYVPVNVSAQ